MKYLKAIILGFNLGFIILGVSAVIWIFYIEITALNIWTDTVVAVEVNRVSHNPCRDKAMKYHGVLVTKWDAATKRWMFYRDNQWISLYDTIPQDKR